MARRTTVLVVDDNGPTRALIKQYLQELDIESVEASDGDQAIALLLKRDFDLVLLDILMPNRDGFEVLQWATRHGCTVPVVAISQERAGTSNTSYATMATGMGAVKGIDKPITPDKLAEALDMLDIRADRISVTTDLERQS